MLEQLLPWDCMEYAQYKWIFLDLKTKHRINFIFSLDTVSNSIEKNDTAHWVSIGWCWVFGIGQSAHLCGVNWKRKECAHSKRKTFVSTTEIRAVSTIYENLLRTWESQRAHESRREHKGVAESPWEPPRAHESRRDHTKVSKGTRESPRAHKSHRERMRVF